MHEPVDAVVSALVGRLQPATGLCVKSHPPCMMRRRYALAGKGLDQVLEQGMDLYAPRGHRRREATKVVRDEQTTSRKEMSQPAQQGQGRSPAVAAECVH